jgi:protein-S-isoprenylcysteine O-methyltransferase Ste14
MLVAPALRVEPLVGNLRGAELWAFGAADAAIVASSAVAAIAIGHRCRSAWVAMVATAAASAYPAVYFVTLAVSGNGGEVAAVLMVYLTMTSAIFAVASLPLAGRLPGRMANVAKTGRLLLKTTIEIAIIWAAFLWLAPTLLARVDHALGLTVVVSAYMTLLATALVVGGGSLLVWSAYHMAWRGRGTPFPLDAPRALVVDGPYRWVRNPQVVGGAVQGIGLILLNPTLTFIAYLVGGVMLWQLVLRPWEEADLLDRFGQDYADYRRHVPCWHPTLSPRRDLQDPS